MNPIRLIATFALVAVLSTLAIVHAETMTAAPAEKGTGSAQRTIDAFTKAIKDDAHFDAALKEEVVKAIAADAKTPVLQPELIANALARLYPEFGKALTALGDENNAGAVAILKPLASSPDPYLAAHASFYLARACLAQDEYELALPLLQDVTDKYLDKTLNTGEALFLKGVCLRKTLKRQEAMDAFIKFLKEYPDVPERLQIGALQQLGELHYLKDGTLDDVTDRMGFVEGRLGREKTDKDITQPEEGKIISILDKLIKDAEDKEKQGSGSGSGHSKKGGKTSRQSAKKPDNPANQSITRPGEAPDPNLNKMRGGDPNWVKDRDKERDKVLEAVKGKMSDRDRELIERYFRNLMEGNRGAPPSDEPDSK